MEQRTSYNLKVTYLLKVCYKIKIEIYAVELLRRRKITVYYKVASQLTLQRSGPLSNGCSK
jgi:hypothetical protein